MLKKKIEVISVIILVIITISTISLGFSIDMNINNTEEIKVDDEIILTISLSQKIVGASFKINYDNTNLKLVGSKTTNLSVSENGSKIACVYVDMAKVGVDNLQIKFKILNNINDNMEFNLEDSKFITLDTETTYYQDNITGITKTIKIEQTSNNENNNSIDNANTNNIENDIEDNTNNIIINDVNNNENENSTGNANVNKNDNINTVSNIQTNNEKNTIKKDETTASTKIPQTGTNYILYFFIALLILIAIYSAIKIRIINCKK